MNKILIVDDEKQVIQQVSNLIQNLGYEIAFITRADHLFLRLEEESFDLILLDINLAGTDGITLLKEIKAQQKYALLNVIMLTSDTDEKTLAHCFELGATDYITKPIRELVLKSRIKVAIDKQNYITEINKQKEALEIAYEQLKISEKKLFMQNEQVQASLQYAKRMQNSILADAEHILTHFTDGFIFYEPKDIVSGDFYWFAEVRRKATLHSRHNIAIGPKNEDPERISDTEIPTEERFLNKVLIAADCTGHGIPGALMTMIGNTLLNQIINENKITDPGEILEALEKSVNDILQRQFANRQIKEGMDISVLVFEEETHTLYFASAKQPLYYVRNGEMYDIKGEIFPIGGNLQTKLQKKFITHTLNFQKGDIFYVFSDGFQDQFGGKKGKKYMKQHFKDFLFSISALSIAEQKQKLKEELVEWQRDLAQTDDIMVIAIKI